MLTNGLLTKILLWNFWKIYIEQFPKVKAWWEEIWAAREQRDLCQVHMESPPLPCLIQGTGTQYWDICTTRQLWGSEQGSDHQPSGPVWIQGHRTGTRERQKHITDNKMARGKQKSISQRKQDNLPTPVPSYTITANSGMPNPPEKEDTELKSYLKTRIEILKEEQEEK